MVRLYSAMLAALLLTACGAGQDQPASDTAADSAQPAATVELDPAKGIDWFDGSVEEAFAAALETGKPTYLYWGAAWCPPCHAISATIFKSPEFIERSKLFIPVYLDGDTENAQAYGEQFGVRGYPTMIVFDSSGTELTRIPGGIDLQAYANILDLTLNNISPASEIVAALMAGDAGISATDCTLLAYYSWGQDTKILTELDAGDAFRRMYKACPDEQIRERSILYLAWLDEALDAAAAEEDPIPLTDEQKAEALQQVTAVLADAELIRANIFFVLFSGADYTSELSEADSDDRRNLEQAFMAALESIAADESVYKRERIYTLVGKIDFERMDDEEAEISAGLKQEIRAMVAWADETTPSVYERQPIINALGNVLDEVGMDDDARTLLTAELDRSRQPYYFMVSLGDIEQRAGNFDVAIDWFKKAHDATKGPATRFQWGYYYVVSLLEMAPTDTQRIHDATVALISELQNSSGFYLRPKAQLSRLEGHLITWGEENDQQAGLSSIRQSVIDVCAAASHQDESRKACDAFLESV